NGARRVESLVVADADDVRATRRRIGALGAVDAMETETPIERRVAPEVRRSNRAASRVPRTNDSRSRTEVECRHETLRLRRDRLGGVPASDFGRRAVQRRTARAPCRCARRRRLGARCDACISGEAYAPSDGGLGGNDVNEPMPLFEVFIR